MNEEEKQALKNFEDLLKKHFEETSVTSGNFLDGVKGIQILNIIENQQKEIDSLYKMLSTKDDEIEELKEDYQILKDDIEGHRIAYVDTPEFEENYISKDKIRHIRDKAECMDYYSLNDVIDDLSKLLGE